MRRSVLLVTTVWALLLMTSADIAKEADDIGSVDDEEDSARAISQGLMLLKKNYEADDRKSEADNRNPNTEDGISFELPPEVEEEVTRGGNLRGILRDEKQIDPEDFSPAGDEYKEKVEGISDDLEDNPKSESFEKRGVLSREAAAFLKAHNDKRRLVSPTATNMKEMQWSTELEGIARNYAKKCTFAHNSQRSSSTAYYVGENLFVSSGDMSPEQAVTSWDNEKKDYTFSSNWCDPNSKYGCGHYTQVVWANSETVGCVKHFCNYIRNFNNRGYLVVCNYGPGGNVNRRRPYTSGTTCKDCPTGYTCVNKLCSKSTGGGGGGSNPCSTNPCKNGGTCTGNAVCQCADGWSGSTCETRDRSLCSQNPCKNGGTCWDLRNRFICRCPPSYSGLRCETGSERSFGCNFERNMCLKNYRKNEVNFRRLSYLRMNSKTISAPEGSNFAVVYAGFIIGQKDSYLLSGYLPEAIMRVTFTYRIVGTGQLKFIYKNKDMYNPKTVFSSKTSDGDWKSWTVTIPSGKQTYYYFHATLERNSVIGIDNVKVKVYQ